MNHLSYFIQRYFMHYLIGQKNYGQNTLSSYRDTFKLLIKFLKENGYNISRMGLGDLTSGNILEFLKWLESSRNNSPTTRNTRLAHIKSFYSFVSIENPEHIDTCSKISRISFIKTKQVPPKYLQEEIVKELLDSINQQDRTGIRHLAIITLLYDSACRVQELINLNVSDIKLDSVGDIYVRGKGAKHRHIPLLPQTCKVLQKYLGLYQLQNERPLFTNSRGERLTRQGIGYILNKYINIIRKRTPDRVETKISPHILRHSKATHLVNAGVSIYNVRDFLGHSSVETTQIYLTSSLEITQRAIETASNKIVHDSSHYYTVGEKDDLLNFLDTFK